ncbi:MAG TPA: biotin/lipoyl-containing protein, partial [Candidatus Acidoferrales bacterium]|nr:biotin/lipoyl-containing protein [Candidatus Acidoferrales bacterium]
IHLGERDCSVQRRHQKIVEEAPAPAMTPELRGRMGDAAVRIARSVGYVNAGTVEFLFDENGAFFFLEMNARLQVEHPVTESVYGVDIVRLQLRIAGGEQLALVQRDVVAHGWAIEARVNAENPATSLPVAGTIEEWQMPPLAGVRIDSGVRSGSEVPIEYDALLAKVIASGADRTQALDRLTQALERLVVHGIPTNVPLLLRILRDPVFRAGRATTAFLGERHVLHDDPGAEPLAVWYLAFAALLRDGIGWRIGSVGVPITLLGPQASRSVIASRCANDGHWKIAGDLDVELQFEGAGDEALIVYDGAQRLQGRAWVDRGGVTVRYAEASYRFTFGRLRRREPERADLNVDGRALVTAPMPGRIGRVAVSVGEQVHEGDLLIVLEAMKMEHRIEASRAGRVRAVHVTPGLLVKSGDDLAEIE